MDIKGQIESIVKKIKDDDKFCGNCGQKINWIEYATSTKNQI